MNKDKDGGPHHSSGDIKSDRATGDDSGDRDDYEYVSTVPVDSGYAWFILAGYITMGCFSMGMLRINGIIFLEFMDYFGSTPGNTSWVISILLGISLSGIPSITNTFPTTSLIIYVPIVGGFIVPSFGARRVVFVGACLQTSSFILSSFVTKLEHLFATMTIIYGIGFSLVLVPTIGHVALYFDKRRGLVNGLGTAASSAGPILTGTLITYLTDVYGLRGALLILGGIQMHVLITAMLLRPTSFYKPKLAKCTKGVENVAFNTDTLSPIEMMEKDIADFLNSKTESGARRQQTGSDLTDAVGSRIAEDRNPKCCKCLGKDYSFIRAPRYHVHVVVTVLTYLGMNSVHVILIPTLADEVGFTAMQGSFLLSIEAVADGIGRIVFGWLLDREFLPKPVTFAITLYVNVIAMSVYPLTGSNFTAAACSVAVVGFFTGIIHPANFTLLAEKVGPDHLSRALAVTFLFLCVPSVFSFQIPAELYEEVGSWIPSYYISAGMMFVAGSIVMAEYTVLRYKKCIRDKDSRTPPLARTYHRKCSSLATNIYLS